MFEYKYKVPKSEFKTTYGSICINNIVFEPNEIERVLPEIVFKDDNLKHSKRMWGVFCFGILPVLS